MTSMYVNFGVRISWRCWFTPFLGEGEVGTVLSYRHLCLCFISGPFLRETGICELATVSMIDL